MVLVASATNDWTRMSMKRRTVISLLSEYGRAAARLTAFVATPTDQLIAYPGWVGHSNLGDEAILEAVQRYFQAYAVRYVPAFSNRTARSMIARKKPSIAMLGDIVIAEPKALIGFAGPRVIEQTVRETLPEGFQRSEFLLKHGSIDMIVDRRAMRNTVASLLAMLTGKSSNLGDEQTSLVEAASSSSLKN